MRCASEQSGASHARLPSRSLAYHFRETFPGSTPVLALHQPLGNQVIAAFGFGPRAALTFAPLVGTMEIAPSYTLFFSPHWFSDRVDLPLPIPANPALTGVTMLFQSLAGSNLFFNAQGAFSNCHELTIQ